MSDINNLMTVRIAGTGSYCLRNHYQVDKVVGGMTIQLIFPPFQRVLDSAEGGEIFSFPAGDVSVLCLDETITTDELLLPRTDVSAFASLTEAGFVLTSLMERQARCAGLSIGRFQPNLLLVKGGAGNFVLFAYFIPEDEANLDQGINGEFDYLDPLRDARDPWEISPGSRIITPFRE